MADEKMTKLSHASKELNVGIATIVEKLATKGIKIENNPNTRINVEQLKLVATELGVNIKDTFWQKKEENAPRTDDFSKKNSSANAIAEKKSDTDNQKEPEVIRASQNSGYKVVGKINLEQPKSNNNDKGKFNNQNQGGQKKDYNNNNQGGQKKDYNNNNQGGGQKKDYNNNNQGGGQKKDYNNNNQGGGQKKDYNNNNQGGGQKKDYNNNNQGGQKKDYNNNNQGGQKKDYNNNNQGGQKKDFVQDKPVQKVDIAEDDLNLPIELIKGKAETLSGLKVLGKIELPIDKKITKNNGNNDDKKKRKRKKRRREAEASSSGAVKPNTPNNNQNNNQNKNNNGSNQNKNNSNQNNNSQNKNNSNQNNNNQNKNNSNQNNNNKNKRNVTPEISDKQIQEQIKATLAKLGSKNNKTPKEGRRAKEARKEEKEANQQVEDTKIIKVAEFISANDLASMMNVAVTDVISVCLSLGMFVSINQRLDAKVLDIIADEFGYKVEFVSAVEEEKQNDDIDSPENLKSRAPIVTIMGHVDHGKTSLLDYIRRANVASGEHGGITQHIGAYNVTAPDGRMVTFLDTPGHEAFTAMRARGAKMTDIVVLVVAADDSVMPQTEEAINHAKDAGVPIIVAVNKVDKPNANPDKIRQELAGKNLLVESWGGKVQDQDISAKKGLGIDLLLEKIMIEADVLDLKANPDKKATGTVIEASLDKGKGYVTNIMVQNGTLKIGDIILVGSHYGKVRAMINYKGEKIKTAGPSVPVQVLGLDGAPQAGDLLKVMETEREAREIATRREQLIREQSIRTTRGLTLEEIGRRRALGNFKELKLIVKGDVDGSVEALSDALLNLSTEEIEVKIIHKGVGQITETDINLAITSEAIVIGFQVRPSNNAKMLADKDKVQIKLYSVIYSAIDEIKDAMRGMLAPKFEEIITANVEVREVFKISKIGTIAGCRVIDGTLKRQSKVRLVRDSIVVFEGDIASLKHEKQDVGEIRTGFECGVGLKNFHDIRIGDIIEAFEQKEIKRTL